MIKLHVSHPISEMDLVVKIGKVIFLRWAYIAKITEKFLGKGMVSYAIFRSIKDDQPPLSPMILALVSFLKTVGRILDLDAAHETWSVKLVGDFGGKNRLARARNRPFGNIFKTDGIECT